MNFYLTLVIDFIINFINKCLLFEAKTDEYIKLTVINFDEFMLHVIKLIFIVRIKMRMKIKLTANLKTPRAFENKSRKNLISVFC